MDTKETVVCTNCKRSFPKAFSKCPYCKTKNKNK